MLVFCVVTQTPTMRLAASVPDLKKKKLKTAARSLHVAVDWGYFLFTKHVFLEGPNEQ